MTRSWLPANVVDPNVGDTHTFSLVDDAGGRFKLVGSDLQVADGTQLDLETAASHGVTVRVTDAGGLTFDKAFTLDITDVDEAPTDLTLSPTPCRGGGDQHGGRHIAGRCRAGRRR